MAKASAFEILQMDERTDVLASLSSCLLCVKNCDQDPGLWKWAILSLHSAVQGGMVCHLSGTAQLGALTKKSASDWLDWHERDRRGEIKRIDCGTNELGMPQFRIAEGYGPPPERLADTRELFKRLGDMSKRIEPGAGGVVEITLSERESLQRLHGLRNKLAHFTPKGWSIELDGIPVMFLDVLGIIEKIAADPWPFRHMDEADSIRRAALLRQLREELNAIRPWAE